MSNSILEYAKTKRIIVAHRGVSGGNIPCNTLASCEIALKMGADMLEIDVEMSADGKLYVFHPGEEANHLCCMERISRMTSEEIKLLRYVNIDRVYTQFGVNTRDEILETFRGRCFINVDKFWGHPKEIYEAIKRHGMTDQILAKSTYSEKVLSVLTELAPDLPYMVIAEGSFPQHEALLKSHINYIGVEALFSDDSEELAQEGFVDMLHRDGILLWGNSIVYNHKVKLSGIHSDDTALTLDPELGWGWFARHGYDFIQTDWPMPLADYLNKKGLLYK